MVKTQKYITHTPSKTPKISNDDLDLLLRGTSSNATSKSSKHDLNTTKQEFKTTGPSNSKDVYESQRNHLHNPRLYISNEHPIQSSSLSKQPSHDVIISPQLISEGKGISDHVINTSILKSPISTIFLKDADIVYSATAQNHRRSSPHLLESSKTNAYNNNKILSDKNKTITPLQEQQNHTQQNQSSKESTSKNQTSSDIQMSTNIPATSSENNLNHNAGPTKTTIAEMTNEDVSTSKHERGTSQSHSKNDLKSKKEVTLTEWCLRKVPCSPTVCQHHFVIPFFFPAFFTFW